MSSTETEKLLTRRALAAWLTDQGFQISHSTLAKYCMPSINCGPPSEGYWGRMPMYRPSVALEWARARLRAVDNNLGMVKPHSAPAPPRDHTRRRRVPGNA